MGWKSLLIRLGCGVLPLAVGFTVLLAVPRDRSAERVAARAVAAQLEGLLAAHAAVVTELAERFSQWETLPEPAVLDALRAAATRHLALRQLLVADGAGRLLAGYDTDRPPGREGLTPGSLDSGLGRREALRGGGLVVASRSRAGRVERLDIAAPIRRTDGTRQGYVGASVSLGSTRRLLRRLAGRGLSVAVVDGQGALVYPCRGTPPRGGTTVRSGQFQVTVVERQSLPWGAATLASLLALVLLLGVLRALDRRR